MKNKKPTSDTKEVEIKEKKIKDKRLGLNQVLKPVMFLLIAFLFEIINFQTLKMGVLPVYILFDIGVFLLFAGIIFLCGKNWLSNIFFFLFLAIQLVLNVANAAMIKSTEDVFYFELLKLSSEAMDSFDIQFLDIESIFYNSLLMVLTIPFVIVVDHYGKKKRFNTKGISKPVLLFVMFFFAWVSGATFYSCEVFHINNNKTKNSVTAFDSTLWEDMEYKYSALQRFGTYGFYIKDFYNGYLKKIDYDAAKAEYVKWIKEGEVAADPSAALSGKNLIVICMESIDSFGLDPYNTPTLWSLCYGDELKQTSGSAVYMDNFYTKNKTNISEDIGLLGYIPKTTKLSFDSETALSIKYALPKLFNEQGYKTSYFHSYMSTFYNRKELNSLFGFKNLYFLDDATFEGKTTEFAAWNSEVDFFNSMKDKMISTDEPFFSFYMTVSAHGDYNDTKAAFKNYYTEYDNNYQTFKAWFDANTDYTFPTDPATQENFRQFKCGVMDTDRMVAAMINYLNEKKLMQSTTILLYADHDCFYNELSSKMKTTDKQYNVPLIIYDGSKTLSSKVVSNFCSSYNIYPTICSLYGLAYNTNMCQGVSLFDENLEINKDLDSSVFYSTASLIGYFDDKCKSTTLQEVIKLKDGVTNEDVQRFLKNANALHEKQLKLNFIYRSGWDSSILK